MGLPSTFGDLAAERRLRSIAWILAGLGALYVLGQWIVSDSTTELVYAGMAFAILAVTFRILGNWREGFLIFFVWLLFEDLIRKYMGNSMLIFFAKDFLIGVTYIAFLAAARRKQVKIFHPPFWIPLNLLIWLAALQIFNPNSPSMLYGILGIKLYYYYAGLMFIGYALVHNEEMLRRLLVLNMGLAGIIALLGIIQSIVGLNFLNPPTLAPELQMLGHLVRQAPLTHEAVPRPTSVFVSDGRFAQYMMIMFIIGFGAVAYMVLRRARGQFIVFLSIPLIVLAGYMSGSRGAMVYDAANLVVLSLGILWGSQRGTGLKLVSVVQRSAILIAIALVTVIILYPKEVGARYAFYAETLFPSSSAYELSYRAWNYPIDNFVYAFTQPHWIMGNGTGTASNGVQYISGRLGVPAPGVGVENGYGAMMLEMGVLAPIFWVIFTFSFLTAGYKVLKAVKETYLFPIALSILYFSFLLLGPLTFGAITAYHNFINNAFFWIFAGVLFRLPSLLQRAAATSPAISTPRGA
jgi:hypothetical protein